MGNCKIRWPDFAKYYHVTFYFFHSLFSAYLTRKFSFFNIDLHLLMKYKQHFCVNVLFLIFNCCTFQKIITFILCVYIYLHNFHCRILLHSFKNNSYVLLTEGVNIYVLDFKYFQRIVYYQIYSFSNTYELVRTYVHINTFKSLYLCLSNNTYIFSDGHRFNGNELQYYYSFVR